MKVAPGSGVRSPPGVKRRSQPLAWGNARVPYFTHSAERRPRAGAPTPNGAGDRREISGRKKTSKRGRRVSNGEGMLTSQYAPLRARVSAAVVGAAPLGSRRLGTAPRGADEGGLSPLGPAQVRGGCMVCAAVCTGVPGNASIPPRPGLHRASAAPRTVAIPYTLPTAVRACRWSLPRRRGA